MKWRLAGLGAGLIPELLPGTHSPTGRNRINKVAGLTVSAANTPLGRRRDPCDVFAFRIMPLQGAASIDVDFDFDYIAAGAVREAAPRSAPTFWCSSGRRTRHVLIGDCGDSIGALCEFLPSGVRQRPERNNRFQRCGGR
jgi:hypothetical protein